MKPGDNSICTISCKLSWKIKCLYELSKKGSVLWSSFSSGVDESAPKLVQCKYQAKSVISILYNCVNCAFCKLVVLHEMLNCCGIFVSKSCDICGLKVIINCDCFAPGNWW